MLYDKFYFNNCLEKLQIKYYYMSLKKLLNL